MVTRRAWGSVAVLMAVMVALSGLVFLASSAEVNHVRGDFCAWAAVHVREAASQPPNAARTADEQSDRQLGRNLGCQP